VIFARQPAVLCGLKQQNMVYPTVPQKFRAAVMLRFVFAAGLLTRRPHAHPYLGCAVL
jgi:hypothetical protein